MRERKFEERETARLVWDYFRLMLPTTKGRLLERYKEACERLRPGARRTIVLEEETVELTFPTNTKAGLAEVKFFYHDLLKASPEWAFSDGARPPQQAPRRDGHRPPPPYGGERGGKRRFRPNRRRPPSAEAA